MLRTDDDKKIDEFKKFLSIPIINGLSPSSHPTQILSDIFTVEEIKKKPVSKLNITWIGDSNNVLNSLIAASVKFSFRLNVGCPKKYQPDKKILDWAKKGNNKIYIFNDPKKAVMDADVIFSDKVISLNDKVNKKKKLKHFERFKITKKLISYAKKIVFFYIVYLEVKKWMKMFSTANNQKFGIKPLTGFMYKKVFYCIVLEN